MSCSVRQSECGKRNIELFEAAACPAWPTHTTGNQTSPECARIMTPSANSFRHRHSHLTQCSTATDHTTIEREVQIFSPSVGRGGLVVLDRRPFAPPPPPPPPCLPLALFAADIKFRLLVCRSTIVHSRRRRRRAWRHGRPRGHEGSGSGGQQVRRQR